MNYTKFTTTPARTMRAGPTEGNTMDNRKNEIAKFEADIASLRERTAELRAEVDAYVNTVREQGERVATVEAQFNALRALREGGRA